MFQNPPLLLFYLFFFLSRLGVSDQETSKKFLSGDERDKYNFFAQATLIEKMENEFQTADRISKVTSERVISVKTSLDLLNDEKKKAEDEVAMLQDVDQVRSKLEEAEGKIAWFCVREVEQEIETLQEQVPSAEEIDKGMNLNMERTLLSHDDELISHY